MARSKPCKKPICSLLKQVAYPSTVNRCLLLCSKWVNLLTGSPRLSMACSRKNRFLFALRRNMSKIEWTNNTWNPITGCSKLSPGCAHCYAEVMTRRLQAMGQVKYQDGFEVVKFHEEALHLPATWKKPSMVFVNSMSDMFHGDLTPETLHQIFSVMNQCDWHTFQVLTKRSDRLREMAEYLTWTPNIWMGVSVENKRAKTRIDDLRQVGAAVRFLSVEPLLEDLGELNLAGIDWVV